MFMTVRAPESRIHLDGQDVALRFRRNHKARNYILRVNKDGAIVVTLPTFGTQREALTFANEHQEWLVSQLLEHKTRVDAKCWGNGTLFMFRGCPVRLDVDVDLFGVTIRFGDEVLTNPQHPADLRFFVMAHLRKLAKEEISQRAHQLAAEHGLRPTRITTRSQRTLWGSCSKNGALSLNWRLVLAPPWVRDYVIIHELAHLSEFNHSRRFWATVQKAFPGYRRAERWLKDNGEVLLA